MMPLDYPLNVRTFTESQPLDWASPENRLMRRMVLAMVELGVEIRTISAVIKREGQMAADERVALLVDEDEYR